VFTARYGLNVYVYVRLISASRVLSRRYVLKYYRAGMVNEWQAFSINPLIYSLL
jgi:hypothetical protein